MSEKPKARPVEKVSVSHTSKTLTNNQFVNFEPCDNIFNLPQVFQGFDVDAGVFTVQSTATYLFSVILAEGNTNLRVKFSHPEVNDTFYWDVPYQSPDVIDMFHRQPTTNAPDAEVFVDNLMQSSSSDTYPLQNYRRAVKRNLRKKKLKEWRDTKRKGSVYYFHFPQHTDVRKAREVREETLEEFDKSAFDSTNVDLISTVIFLVVGTNVTLEVGSRCEVPPSVRLTVAKFKDVITHEDLDRKYIKSGKIMRNLKKGYGCYKCGNNFETSNQIVQHFKDKKYFMNREPDTVKPPFVSPVTGKRFQTENALKQHMKNHHFFKCTHCKSKFNTEDGLKNHLIHSHTRKRMHYRKKEKKTFHRPGVCCVKEGCGSIFKDPTHMVIHHKFYDHYSCNICSKRFHTKQSLFHHSKLLHRNEYERRLISVIKGKLKREPSRKAKNPEKAKKLKEKLEKRLTQLFKLHPDMSDMPDDTPPEVLVTEGPLMTKSPNSQSVINIVPPRQMWGPIQAIRTLNVANARCGPHFSFLDPFVLPKHYPIAAELLKEELKTFPPFKVHLKSFSYFNHAKSYSLFIVPETTPDPNAFNKLLKRCLKVFPQCNDLVVRGGEKGFVAHMTIAKYETYDQLKTAMDNLTKVWKPITFEIKELYFLARQEGDPFEVKHVIPLGGDTRIPYFGPLSVPGSERSSLASSALLCDIPKGFNAEQVRRIISCEAVEILKNPDGSPRQLAVVRFSCSHSEVMELAKNWKPNWSYFAIERGTQPPNEPYLIPLPSAVFPALGLEDCCSYDAAKKIDLQGWMNTVSPSYFS
eukprot:TRINITY_DN2078_c1_g3_i1.p1 TRINITY_DN2078_c1_g3~~TRINITY_DN2078_c1_g3_i1.p1  ORF type:complete len:805 (+),score=126.33 TRINITY_DN2078_c1_g3_i1:450-2864(+)